MLIRYCTNCDAQLDKQLGFSESVPYWQCRGCGRLLINPEMDLQTNMFLDVMWFCDECGELLNTQSGFSDDCGFWICDACEHINVIADDNIL